MKTIHETTFTSGPWQVNSGMVETTAGIPIAYMDRNPGNGTMPVERDQNARLIAAAPDMLAILQTLYAEMERGHSINPYELKANVAQAITKAIG